MTQPTTAQKPPFVAWKAFYSMGDDHLDGQHQELLSLIYRLKEAFGRGDERDALPGIARRLADYTATHFRDEERAMEEASFPEIAEHRRVHREYMEETCRKNTLYSDEPFLVITVSGSEIA